MDKLLHTPEGVRDIYNSEFAKKKMLEQELGKRLALHGFREIQTPMFEFLDIFSKERGSVSGKEMYKFFDREGNTLVLRPDITPSIARCVAKYYKTEQMPIRLSYCGSTFINSSSYQGKLKEATQLGAELINDASIEADAEMIALTVECLQCAGVKEFQVEIGQADFFHGIVEEAGFDEEETEQLRVLIENKNLLGVEELIRGKHLEKPVKSIILQLTDLFGTLNKVLSVKESIHNERARKALERMEKLYELLTLYGYEQYITFDLGMLSKYNYYTGIIFRAYTYGTGDAVITGGRYDSLVGQFGKQAPAIGMAVLVDQLLIALNRQKLMETPESENTLILYESSYIANAVALANHFREQEMKIEMLVHDGNRTREDYITYAKRMGIGGILSLLSEEEVEVIHAMDGSVRTVPLKGMLS